MTPEGIRYDDKLLINDGKAYTLELKQCKENEDALEQILLPLYIAVAVMGWEDY